MAFELLVNQNQGAVLEAPNLRHVGLVCEELVNFGVLLVFANRVIVFIHPNNCARSSNEEEKTPCSCTNGAFETLFRRKFTSVLRWKFVLPLLHSSVRFSLGCMVDSLSMG